MRVWLAAAAAPALLVPVAADAQANAAPQAAPATPNFAIPVIPQFNSQQPAQDGMVAEEDVAPNVHVGLGLAPMLGRNIHSVRIEQDPVPTRNPGVTFVFKFPG